jgi:hypothetical protein
VATPTGEQVVEKVAAMTAPPNKLPEDPKEFDAAIGPSKIMVRPMLHAISKLCEAVDTDPLDKDEIESGSTALGALMYQYGAMLDARVLVTIWLASVSLPRVTQYLEAKQKKEEPKTALEKVA